MTLVLPIPLAAPATTSRGIEMELAITLNRVRIFAYQVNVHRGRLWHVDGPRRKTASYDKPLWLKTLTAL